MNNQIKPGVTRKGKYEGNYKLYDSTTSHDEADKERLRELEMKEASGTLPEEMEPYLAYLRGKRHKGLGKFANKLQKLVRESGMEYKDLGKHCSVGRDSLREIAGGCRGVLSEPVAEKVFHEIRDYLHQ